MASDTAELEAPATTKGMTRAYASAAQPNYVTGRRAFFKYRDLGVTKASKGRMRAQITSASAGMTQPTGWHYHLCESQFVFVLDGWLELEFAGNDKVRLEAGDSIFIPGGLPHNETRTSDTFNLLEVSVPAEMGTKACDAPG
jgi:quercetin dioxygenase-like cupin family protein